MDRSGVDGVAVPWPSEIWINTPIAGAASQGVIRAHYGSQPHWGCPTGALATELIGSEPEGAAER